MPTHTCIFTYTWNVDSFRKRVTNINFSHIQSVGLIKNSI